ncbi:MAG TPA: hypothetical protein VFU89_02820 [Rhabdochlamydiaceae bacterium]|nr:hypothetical protein [Rhabdochlamydiaceae bacterium]
MSVPDCVSSCLTHLSQHFENTHPVKRDLESFIKALEQQVLSPDQIEQTVDSIAKSASLYNKEQDSKFISALVSIEENQEGYWVYKYPLAVACLLNHYPTPSLSGPSPEEEHFFWESVSSSWGSNSPDILLRLYQLRQTGILNLFSANVQKKFYENFLANGGETIPFAMLPQQATQAMLEEIWNDGSLRSTLLLDPYLVLRCLPYTSLLTPERALELKEKWEWFVKTKELEHDGQTLYSWDEINFSHYSSSAVWARDGIPDLPPLTLQELRRLPRILRILHLAAPASRLGLAHPIADFPNKFEYLFFFIALSHPSPYESIGKLLDPDTLCYELQEKVKKDFDFLRVSHKEGDLSAFWKVALAWCVESCVPYNKAKAEEEKKRIKQMALHQIETTPEKGFTLWWVSQIIPPFSLCAQLFDTELRNSSAFIDLLYKEFFGKMVARERSFDGWRLFVYVCLTIDQRETSFKNFDNRLSSLSDEEEAFVLTIAQAWRETKSSPLTPKELSSFLTNKTIETYETLQKILYNKTGLEQLDASSKKTISTFLNILKIDQLFNWRARQTSLPPLMDIQIILHLRKIASDLDRSNFQIAALAANEAPKSFPPTSCFSQLPLELFNSILKFVLLSDHANWCLVSKACWSVGKSQSYWSMRCFTDLTIHQKKEDKTWSETYREGYYFNQWIPQRFQHAIGRDRPQTFVTMAYPALALNKKQLKKVWSKAEIDAFDDTPMLPFKWLRSLKMNQGELLRFFDHALFAEPINYASYTSNMHWDLTTVSALAVEENSVEEILKKISTAPLLSQPWNQARQNRFMKDKEKIEEGLSLCFGEQFIKKAVAKLPAPAKSPF